MATGLHKSDFQNPVIRWVDARLPVFTMMQKEYGTFPTPRNFNYFWNFGALAMVNLVVMIATGIFLNRNNLIVLLMAIELILLAVNINLVAFSAFLNDLVGQVFAMFVLTVAAGEAAIGLAILVIYFRGRGTIAVDDVNRMKG